MRTAHSMKTELTSADDSIGTRFAQWWNETFLRSEPRTNGTLSALIRARITTGIDRERIALEVAEELFFQALDRSGGESDIGLFGPRIFLGDARTLVRAEIG